MSKLLYQGKEITAQQMYKMKTGEVVKLTRVALGEFIGRLYSENKKSWTDYHLKGKSEKLPSWLEANEAVEVLPSDYPKEPPLKTPKDVN